MIPAAFLPSTTPTASPKSSYGSYPLPTCHPSLASNLPLPHPKAWESQAMMGDKRYHLYSSNTSCVCSLGIYNIYVPPTAIRAVNSRTTTISRRSHGCRGSSLESATLRHKQVHWVAEQHTLLSSPQMYFVCQARVDRCLWQVYAGRKNTR